MTSPASPSRGWRAARVIIVGSVMFTFISYWRTAAVVLCDMSSTVYYIGAIVESAIGKAAPWFILAVLFFSYAMRSVYIESCALFVRGGVYRVVKQAMGGFLAKVSVSALLFDYILTGPISGVSAGQYIVGLILEALTRFAGMEIDDGVRQAIKSWGSVAIACGIVLYFYRLNLLGIRESSDKALKIMIATTLMGVIMLVWCGVTLAVKGPVNDLPSPAPDLSKKVQITETGETVPKVNHITGEQEDPLGFLSWFPGLAEMLRQPDNWLTIVGIIGVIIAFGHSILAMSGEETLAQVYREVEAPKLANFKKAAFVVFLYSLLLTGTMNFLAVLLIPDHQRMGEYYDNWIGGLAMQLLGPVEVLLLLNGFVVVVGFLILSGAVNTSIIGANGVLNRVAEDGVLPDWFRKPHHRFGTTHRILYLITGLQLVTIIASQGDVILLGEAYAFGVVWSFVFKTLSMVVLRFRDKSPREFKVPFNLRWGRVEVPIGLGIIFLIVFLAALANFFTKQVATVSGLVFTGAFLSVFLLTEHVHERRRRGGKHEHLEQFNQDSADIINREALGLTRPFRKLVAIRSTQNLVMLEKALADADPASTDVVVMTAKVVPRDEAPSAEIILDDYDQHLMTAVVDRAESAGKKVLPLIVPTNNPLHAVLRTAKNLEAQEIVVGASNVFTADEQFDQISLYWINLHGGTAAPLTVRIIGKQRDLQFDLGGGQRLPRAAETRARSIADLRAGGIGVRRALLILENTRQQADLYQTMLTLVDPEVDLTVALLPASTNDLASLIQEQAEQLDRPILIQYLSAASALAVTTLARNVRCDVMIIPLPKGVNILEQGWIAEARQLAPCRILFVASPPVPTEPEI